MWENHKFCYQQRFIRNRKILSFISSEWRWEILMIDEIRKFSTLRASNVNFWAEKTAYFSLMQQKKPYRQSSLLIINAHRCTRNYYFFIRLRLISKCCRCFCLLKEISPWKKHLVRPCGYVAHIFKKQSWYPKKSKSLSKMAKWISRSLSLTSISIKCMINQWVIFDMDWSAKKYF